MLHALKVIDKKIKIEGERCVRSLRMKISRKFPMDWN